MSIMFPFGAIYTSGRESLKHLNLITSAKVFQSSRVATRLSCAFFLPGLP